MSTLCTLCKLYVYILFSYHPQINDLISTLPLQCGQRHVFLTFLPYLRCSSFIVVTTISCSISSAAFYQQQLRLAVSAKYKNKLDWSIIIGYHIISNYFVAWRCCYQCSSVRFCLKLPHMFSVNDLLLGCDYPVVSLTSVQKGYASQTSVS